MNRKWFALPHVVWMVVFTIIPLAMLMYYGVTKEAGDGIVLSFDNILKSFKPLYLNALIKSIYYAGISTIICLIIAYPLALILANSKNQSTILFIFILPMWMNFLLRTYAWLTLLETNSGFLNTVLRFLHLPTLNIIGTPNAVILGMVYNFLPFMILPIYNVLSKIDKKIIEAASDLGANQFVRLRKIIIPLSIPGIVSGVLMVFMPAVTSFVIPNLLGSGKINLIGNIIEQQFLATYNWGFGSALSLVLMVMILVSMGIFTGFDKDIKGGNGLW